MPTLLIWFPGGRFHATPWGHHVNEGQIEWPPSPWRMLRALLSVGYTSGLWNEGGPTNIARSLIEKLAGVLPHYRLPIATGAHSRHFMPLATLDKGREKTTLVFDTWARINGSAIAVTWDVELGDEEAGLLAELAGRLNYLGRSESWVEARLARSDETMPTGTDCMSSSEFPMPGPGWEQVPLMAALSARDYADWRQCALNSTPASLSDVDTAGRKPTREERKLLVQRKKATEPYPDDLIACLQVGTNWLRDHGWSQPPGSRKVLYWRRVDALESGAPKMQVLPVSTSPVEAMLLSMATSTGNEHALPSVTRTLPQAELLHRALVKRVTNQGSAPCAAITGRDEARVALRGKHEHAHILPLDLDDDGHLDHFLIWAPMGLDSTAQAAVRAVRRTFTKGGIDSLKLALAGAGGIPDLRNLSGPFGDGLREVLCSAGGTALWVSRTPFVPPRHLKARGRHSLEGQVIAELASRGLPAPVEVRVIDPREDARAMRFRHFVRFRRNGPTPPIDCSFMLALRFEEPVHGPLCLGYGSHYGLGLFAVVEDHDKAANSRLEE